MTIRTLATGLAANRVVFGIGYVLAPARTGRGWIGRVAGDPATQVFTRALGARDLALGAGALRALAAGDDAAARIWLAGHAVSDATDLVATVLARRRLPRSGLAFATLMAAGSTAVAVAGAVGLKSA